MHIGPVARLGYVYEIPFPERIAESAAVVRVVAALMADALLDNGVFVSIREGIRLDAKWLQK
jgi:hypothetical protein